MGIAYTRTATSLTLVVDFRSTVIPSSHPNFAKLVTLAKNPNTTEADIKPLLDIPAAITAYTGGEIKVQGGRLFYRGVEVKNNLATIILGFVNSGDANAAEPFKKFLANCRNNPDLRLVDTIYDWCVKGNMPITPNGELLAWKVVGSDYLSLHHGKRGRLRHQIGDVVIEPREECDPNRNQTCSTGIHFASLEYLETGGYGGGSNSRYMAVVINPADITAIPTDYNLSKGRCCKLTVVGEVDRSAMKGYYGAAKVFSGWDRPAPVKASPRNAYGYAVGQTWTRRNGSKAVIETLAAGSDYPLRDKDGKVYTANGRYNSLDSQSQFDLVMVTKDVA